jgi:hypothetical protein
LVASCRISESSATQQARIKIQANIIASLLRHQPDRSIARSRWVRQLTGTRRAGTRCRPRADRAFCVRM